MAKLSSAYIEGEGEMAKRRKTNEGGKSFNIPSSQILKQKSKYFESYISSKHDWRRK
jgi:hypothetical protein